MKKKWKKIIAAWCAAALLMTMPGMYVLADEMAEEELIVTEAEVQEEIVDSVDSPVEDVTDDVDAPITEENIDEEEAEEVVGEGPIQVGDGVTATFDADTGAVEFVSQDGELWPEWVDKLGVSRSMIKSIKVSSGTVYLPADSSGYKDKYRMFGGLTSLTNLDLGSFDTSNVTDMSYMFYNCDSLTNLDLSSFDTSNVTDMNHMFSYFGPRNRICSLYLNLSSFDTSNVTDMSYMFYKCGSVGYSYLQNLDLSSFNTSKVTDMHYMFCACLGPTNLDLSNFDTSNVTNMRSMFSGHTFLNLNLNSFDTSNVTDMSYMFNCVNLEKLDLSSFDTSNVTNMSHMFYMCHTLTNLELSNFNTSNVTDMSSMFHVCADLTNLDLSGFDTSNVTDMSYMFNQCDRLTNLDLSNFDTSNVKNMEYMFYHCMFYSRSDLTNLDLSSFDTSNVTDMNHMFRSFGPRYQHSSLYLNLSSFDTSNVTDMYGMFDACQSLTNLDLSSFNMSKVQSATGMFNGCRSLQLLKTPKNNRYNITLPHLMYDESAAVYTTLPKSNKSIVLVLESENAVNGGSKLVSGILREGDGWSICWQITYDENTSGDKTNAQLNIYLRGSNASDGSLLLYSLLGNGFLMPWLTDEYGFSKSAFNRIRITGGEQNPFEIISDTFSGYDNVTNVAMYKVKSVQSRAFENCTNISTLGLDNFLTTINDASFRSCSSLNNIYYYGTRADWNKISIGTDNGNLTNATVHYMRHGTIYTSGDNIGGLTNEILLERDFEDCVLKNASTEYNPELAFYLSALCRSAYGLAKDNKTFEEQTINIKKSLRSLGFDIDSYFVCDYKDDYSPAYTIAKKPLSDESSLVLITIRGSYNLDWANNAAFGPISMLGFGKHYGFEEGAEQIYNMLKRFLGEISSNNVYVITGHSQGGGVGNLLAVKLYDNQVPISNVYNYNFSAPNVACLINPQDWNANGIHDNIFNIALDYDPVSFLPCNSLPVFDVNPLATWGKFGRSFWYVPNQDDMNLIGHDLKEVVYLMSRKYPLSRFSDYNGFLAGHIKRIIKRILGIHCPVDAVVYDESGKPVAGVINNQAEYYDSEFGDVLIIIDEDEKWICLPNDKDYDVRLSATDSGEMKYEVYDVDLAKDNIISSVKAFENVALASGKEMHSEVDAEDDVSETTLYVLNQNEGIVAEISEDGSEQAAAVLVNDIILQNDTIDLKVGATVQLSAEIRPKYATNKAIKWTSSNRKVVTVDDQGRITAVGAGQAVIEASSVDGGSTASVQIISTPAEKNIADCTITLSNSSYTYNGSAIKPTVTVKDGESVLISGTDYSVNYADNKNAGTAKISIVGQGNYNGTVTENFTINQAAPKLVFSSDNVKKTVSDAAFTNQLTKTTDGTVTFKSSNTNVATVNSTSGQVTIKGAGTATITATATKGTNYKAGSASFILTVETQAPTPPPVVSGFSDVQDSSHPYYKAIYWAAEKGITKGYSDGTFGINRSCTRGEMMMFLWKYAKKPAPKPASKSPFKDVSSSHAFYKAILWGYQNGITKGYSDGSFGINRNVSRGEAMMFLWKLKNKPAPQMTSKSPFTDVPTSHAFYKAILWGSQKGITKGYTSGANKGKFGINDNCTRGQIVTFLYRAQ